jgi:hypothetical protein
MWSSWLDRWDERQAAEDEDQKPAVAMEVGASLAFDGTDAAATLGTLTKLVKTNCASSERFYSADCPASDFIFRDGILTFRSSLTTETDENNLVHAEVSTGSKNRNALVILPHWNAGTGEYRSSARLLSRFGPTVVELTLPYHGVRNRQGGAIADYYLSPNLGRTIRSVRQSVLDTKGVVDWLCQQGYEGIGLIGASLGSCVAGLVAAHDRRVRASALLLSAGDFAEVVWTGRATRHISAVLARSMSIDELRDAWSIISLRTFARALARPDHRMMIISGSRDNVVKPCLTKRFVLELAEVGAACEWREIGCGHYSLGMFPFSVVFSGWLLRFLRGAGLLR